MNLFVFVDCDVTEPVGKNPFVIVGRSEVRFSCFALGRKRLVLANKCFVGI